MPKWRNGRRTRLKIVRETMRVRVPPSAPNKKNPNQYIGADFLFVLFVLHSSLYTFHYIGFVLKWKTKSEKLKTYDNYNKLAFNTLLNTKNKDLQTTINNKWNNFALSSSFSFSGYLQKMLNMVYLLYGSKSMSKE